MYELGQTADLLKPVWDWAVEQGPVAVVLGLWVYTLRQDLKRKDVQIGNMPGDRDWETL
jgi:hypothetical protein